MRRGFDSCQGYHFKYKYLNTFTLFIARAINDVPKSIKLIILTILAFLLTLLYLRSVSHVGVISFHVMPS